MRAMTNPDPVAPGRFSVDRELCLAHETCALDAPEFFAMSSEGYWHAYVKRQPVTPDEVDLCRRALEGCPVRAILDSQNDPLRGRRGAR